MREFSSPVSLSVAALVLTACVSSANGTMNDTGLPAPPPTQAAPNSLTSEEVAAGWRLLFDGKSTAGWRAYGADSMPAGWQAVDGSLTRVSRAADIITREQFGDFEVSLDWKVEPGGTAACFIAPSKGSSGFITAPPNTRSWTTPATVTEAIR